MIALKILSGLAGEINKKALAEKIFQFSQSCGIIFKFVYYKRA